MVPHIAQRLMESLAYLAQTHFFKIEQLQRYSLDFGQIRKSALQAVKVKPRFDLSFHIRSVRKRAVNVIQLHFGAFIEPPAYQMCLAIERTAVSDLDNPGSYASSGWFIGPGFTKKIKKAILNNLLGFSSITENPQGNAVSQPGVAVEQ
jgi:hypothetical protein